jgi:uncharacterized membrane protein
MENKTIGIFGGVGVILSLIGSSIGGVGSLIGFIMLIMAYYYLGEKYNWDIWKKALWSYVIFIIGLVLGVLIAAPLIILLEGWMKVVGGGVGIIVFLIALILGAKLQYDAAKLVAGNTKLDIFRKAGKLNYIGAWLAIILVGFILSFIAQIMLCIGFFKLMSVPEKKAKK